MSHLLRSAVIEAINVEPVPADNPPQNILDLFQEILEKKDLPRLIKFVQASVISTKMGILRRVENIVPVEIKES